MSSHLIDQIKKALENVQDPEIHKSLIELDMVGEIEVTDGIAIVQIILTTARCPLKATIGNDVKKAVMDVAGIKDVSVIYGEMTKEQKEKLIAKLQGRKEQRKNPLEGVKMIAIGSGKGGVGKSTTTAGLAMTLAKMGYKVGLLDADILGYSIPHIMGIHHQQPMVIEGGLILPIEKNGVKMISIGNLVDKNDAVIWRGPMLANALQQLIHDVYWGELDYILLDMPPGTGDIPLNVMQTNPKAHFIIVTTPQSMASGVSRRLGLMIQKVGVKLLGVVENMSYFICDDCDKKHYLFGKGETEALCAEFSAPLLGGVPFVSIPEDAENPEQAATPVHPSIQEAWHQIAKNIIAG